MITRWIDEALTYDGTQLRAHWILTRFGIVGDAIVAFRGPCAVPREEIADLDDVDGPGIAGDDMVHFVSERFDDGGLESAVLRQRLLSCLAREVLEELGDRRAALRRDGDDLYLAERKLSISIATRSAVSTLTHFAVNVVAEGTPVPAAGLEELGVDAREFAERLLERVVAEEQGIANARVKVRARGEA